MCVCVCVRLCCACVCLRASPTSRTNANTARYAEAARTVAADANVPFVDLFAITRDAMAELEDRILTRSEADHWDDGTCAIVALAAAIGERRIVQLIQLGDCNAVLLQRARTGEKISPPFRRRKCRPQK